MIPKFRAFIKANTETVYGEPVYSDDCVLPVGLIDFTDGEVTVWGCGREGCGLCGDDFSLDDIVLMQSTGLKDKNGAEIFEGYIVKVTDDDERTDFSDGGIGTICGLDDLYMWYIDGQVHNGLFDISQQYYIEIIGNIYENPELLEVAE